MDHFQVLSRKVAVRIFMSFFVVTVTSAGLGAALSFAGMSPLLSVGGAGGLFLLLGFLFARLTAHTVLTPLDQVRQAVLHVSSASSHMAAPDLEKIKLGRELVSSLALAVYDMASHGSASQTITEEQANVEASVIGGTDMLNATPLPVFTMTNKDTIHYINDAALAFLGIASEQRETFLNKNINDVLNLSFPNEKTYEAWISDCRKNVLKAGISWDRVRLNDADGNPVKQFDMAASYSKAGGAIESVIVLFDHTDTYANDDQEISFVAMAVHELRTPLTIMRGYIEVFEDELGPTLQPELKDFMFKMHASAQQLTAFVSNILNVARVEENQLVLTLTKQNLSDILQTAVADLELRANVHKKHIELQLPATLPDVAADRISLHEVINNLVDNAIKYSGASEKIIIAVHEADGMVQVDVQDFGVGIPDGVVPKLFDKFYRSHRSKVQIGGTGLGLYLCKAIVTAHGGNIWVKTREGEGSVFSFTIEIYDQAKHGAGATGQEGITRGAHGWIKNHSMYRQ